MEEAVLKRNMPSSKEAEQSVIGSMIMDREAVIMASEILVREDFYYQDCGILFESMLELYNEEEPIDVVTLQNRLREKDVPEQLKDISFVGEMVTSVPTSANIKHYANIVKEKSMLRRLIRVNEDIANQCYLGRDSLEDILADTEKKIFDLLQNQGHTDFVPIKQIVINALERIEQASKTKGNVTGIATGFMDLDYRTSGLQPSDLVLVAARPSMGKTAFVLNSMMPSYVSGFIYAALIDSFCCEQNARMTAMDSANQNAENLMGELSLQYNRVRQAAITQEITEVSAGARAQRQKKER